MGNTQAHNSGTTIGIIRFFGIALLAFVLVCSLSVPALASVQPDDDIYGETVQERQLSVVQCPDVAATKAILADANGTIYFSRNADEPAKIASCTKIMTAIIALEHSQLTDTVIVSEAAAEVGESSANLMAGDILDMESALKALMVPSGNDAAIAVAETVGAKMIAEGLDFSAIQNEGALEPIDAFVYKMNEKAQNLGCTDTVFTNPHGLDDGDFEGDLHSTARDVYIFTKAAMQNDVFRSIVKGGSTTITVSRGGADEAVELETTDLLLEMYKYTIGVKTGTTDAAGACFSGAALKDDREVYAVVLDSTDESQRFVDTQNLFEWYYQHVIDYKLAYSSEKLTIEKDGESKSVYIVAHVAHSNWMDKTVRAMLEDPDASVVILNLDGNVSQSFEFDTVRGNVKVGDKIGTVTFKQHNEEIATCAVVAAEELAAPNFFQRVGIFFKRIGCHFSGQPKEAESVVVNSLPLLNDKQSTTW